MKIEAVIFDFDGTIADGLIAIHKCFVRTFNDLGVDTPSIEAVRGWIGYPLKEICLSLAGEGNESRVEEILILFRKCAREILPRETLLRPGIKPVLDMLCRNEIRMGIATTKKTDSTILTLNNLGIRDYFDAVVGVDMVTNPKPHSEPLELAMNLLGSSREVTVMVGDTHLDILAAKSAGLLSLVVMDGFGDKGSIEKAGPDYEISNTLDLAELLENIINA